MDFENSYPKTSLLEIQALSNELELQLPKEYIDFLLKFNGGQPNKNQFTKQNSDGELLFDFDINVLFGIGRNDTRFDLLTMFSIYCDSIPEELLPIGGDGIGNVICIGVDGAQKGGVFIWWKDKQVDEGANPDYQNVDLIASSFTDFLTGFSVT
ncbi:hypothetical protein CKO50_11990 [Pseudoalteromonas sp. HM-SA03]|uniref:SMI1/KNR4 family protein n=1 Tax=Pseudoalteromonas sp. HM-SA03 TaxID=2029678 RepID=UPI000BAE4BE8|nr:SMI1/KNR4 family protein [Pseudoalteromonas sp. HM-SA03]PAY01126.1 hypothetical protein CKO50_11990 [Pseudoalteromonas sp. HM-SA03]